MPHVYSQTVDPLGTKANMFLGTNPIGSSISNADIVSSSLSQSYIQHQQLQQQQLSPWFPSTPAIACRTGLFSFTINGVPDKDAHIPMEYDRNKGDDDNNNNLLALQLQLNENNGFAILNDNDVQGQISVGEKNIGKNKWRDFPVEDTSNTCRTLAYSSSPDVKIEMPLPTIALNDDGVTQTLSPYCYYYPYYNPPCGIIGQTIPVSIVQDAALRLNQAFQPNPVSVKVGGVITWTNDDTQIHTVTSGSVGSPGSGQIFDSGLLSPGATFTRTFVQPGVIPYYCTLHPQMVGTIVVS